MEESVSENTHTKYALAGIINHRGDSEGGHYVTQIHFDDDTWTEFNDKVVDPTTLDKIHEESDPHTKKKCWTPYVLMYEKIVEEGEPSDSSEDDGEDTPNNSDSGGEEDNPDKKGDGNGGNTINGEKGANGENGINDDDADNRNPNNDNGGDPDIRDSIEGPCNTNCACVCHSTNEGLQPPVTGTHYTSGVPPVHRGSTETGHLVLAGEETLMPGQAHLDINAQINGINIQFPRYLLEDYFDPSTSHDHTTVTLSMTDANNQTGLLSATAILKLGPRGEVEASEGRKRKTPYGEEDVDVNGAVKGGRGPGGSPSKRQKTASPPKTPSPNKRRKTLSPTTKLKTPSASRAKKGASC
jgi:hypothetical protein